MWWISRACFHVRCESPHFRTTSAWNCVQRVSSLNLCSFFCQGAGKTGGGFLNASERRLKWSGKFPFFLLFKVSFVIRRLSLVKAIKMGNAAVRRQHQCLFRRNDDVAHNSTFRTCSSGPAAASTIFHVCLNAAKMDQTRKHIFHWFSFLCQVPVSRFPLNAVWNEFFMVRQHEACRQVYNFEEVYKLDCKNTEMKQDKWDFPFPLCFNPGLPSPSGSFLCLSYHFLGQKHEKHKKWQIWDLFEEVFAVLWHEIIVSGNPSASFVYWTRSACKEVPEVQERRWTAVMWWRRRDVARTKVEAPLEQCCVPSFSIPHS